jgi:hypothetical protein
LNSLATASTSKDLSVLTRKRSADGAGLQIFLELPAKKRKIKVKPRTYKARGLSRKSNKQNRENPYYVKRFEVVQKKLMDRKSSATCALEDLDNPWNDVSLAKKMHFALYEYYLAIEKHPEHGAELSAIIEAADKVQVDSSTVYRWVREYEISHQLHEDIRGKHSKVISPMDDAVFRKMMYEFIKSKNSVNGQPNLTLKDIQEWVHSFYELSEEHFYSEK